MKKPNPLRITKRTASLCRKYWREIIILIAFLFVYTELQEIKRMSHNTFAETFEARYYARSASNYASDAADYASDAADSAQYCEYLY